MVLVMLEKITMKIFMVKTILIYLEKVKSIFDPNGIINPDKIFPLK